MGKCFTICRLLYNGRGYYYKGFGALQLGRQMPLLGLYEAWTTVLDMRDRGSSKCGNCQVGRELLSMVKETWSRGKWTFFGFSASSNLFNVHHKLSSCFILIL